MSVVFFFFENMPFMRCGKNTVEPARTHLNTARRMRTARWIPKATNVHSQYPILTVFPLQRWLHNRTSLLRYKHTVCLVKFLQSETRDKDNNSSVLQKNSRPLVMKPCAN